MNKQNTIRELVRLKDAALREYEDIANINGGFMGDDAWSDLDLSALETACAANGKVLAYTEALKLVRKMRQS